MIKNGDVQLVIATADESRTQISDARQIRQTALAQLGVVYYTTISGAAAAVEGRSTRRMSRSAACRNFTR